ncbi:MAG TPA: ATP synthase subunit I [Desulfotomaculum sp.]|nr:MAG: hypothetical protein JL56_04100 [Desulfotomaculum sp. BICA1-6]HBX23472.1 ATP synthase subunit I [Desulfotomaculum sp.]
MERPAPIRDINQQFSRTTRIMGFIGALTLPGTILYPGDPLILGFLVGAIFGILNVFFLVRRVNTLADLMLIKKAEPKKAKVFMQAGVWPRFGMVVAICAFASQVSFLSVAGVGAGLLMPTVITVVDANLALYRYYTARDAVDKI